METPEGKNIYVIRRLQNGIHHPLMRNGPEVGDESGRETWMDPVCVILSLGVWNSLSGPGPWSGVPLEVGVDFVLRNRLKSCSAI